MSTHNYSCQIIWTGNRGEGTRSYRGYDRNWSIETPGKPVIHCSNDPLLGGNPGLPNPEDLLLSSLAACHMLWFLHLASDANVIVLDYRDTPVGQGEILDNGAGRFVSATLQPTIRLAPDSDQALADSLHARIHDVCFIARSVAFPVSIKASYV